MADYTQPADLGFSRGPSAFPENPSLENLAAELQGALNFAAFSANLTPSSDRAYSLGSSDRQFKEVHAESISGYGTSKFENGVVNIENKCVVDFATGSSLLILPTYTTGNSPWDVWHPSSGFLRDGAVWVQVGSPKTINIRAFGYNRMLGVWDTTTSTNAGSILWERGADDTVRLSETQFADAPALGIEVTATCTFGGIANATVDPSGGSGAPTVMLLEVSSTADIPNGVLAFNTGDSTLYYKQRDTTLVAIGP